MHDDLLAGHAQPSGPLRALVGGHEARVDPGVEPGVVARRQVRDDGREGRRLARVPDVVVVETRNRGTRMRVMVIMKMRRRMRTREARRPRPPQSRRVPRPSDGGCLRLGPRSGAPAEHLQRNQLHQRVDGDDEVGVVDVKGRRELLGDEGRGDPHGRAVDAAGLLEVIGGLGGEV